MVIEIPLTQGKVALIDQDDWQEIGGVPWFACRCQRQKFVAARNRPRSEGRGLIYMSRQIMGLGHGDALEVDHVNHDTLDNRRANLRIVTPTANKRWQPSRGGSSSFVGVTWDRHRQKWRAQIQIDGRGVNLGRYDSELAAARARDDYVLTEDTGHELNLAHV